MDTYVYVLGGIVVLAIYLFASRRRAQRNQSEQPASIQLSGVDEQDAVPHPLDSFERDIANLKRQADAGVEEASKLHRQSLETQYGELVRLKERLSKIAQTNQLDRALTTLWDGLRPVFGRIGDREEIVVLDVQFKEPKQSRMNDTEVIEFVYEDVPYKVTKRDWLGMENDEYSDFALFESGEEVFAISCTSRFNGYGSSYNFWNVKTFRSKGNWAKLLVKYLAKDRVEGNRLMADSSYHSADKIVERFEE